jgi:RIO-like serine/threonine protein kinase
MDALDGAKKSVVVFMESIPQTLNSYIHPKKEEERKPDMAKVEEGIIKTTTFLEIQGMMHFDAHAGNILVDDEGQVCFADFGMALSKDFELSAEEINFLGENSGYDRSQALSSLCRHPKDKVTKAELPILPEVKEMSERYELISREFKKFSDAFKDDETKSVRYPAKEMSQLYLTIKNSFKELPTEEKNEFAKKFSSSKKAKEFEDVGNDSKKSWADKISDSKRAKDDSVIKR